jgi:hypothetical protein
MQLLALAALKGMAIMRILVIYTVIMMIITAISQLKIHTWVGTQAILVMILHLTVHTPSQSDTMVPDTDTTSTDDEGGDSFHGQRHLSNCHHKR